MKDALTAACLLTASNIFMITAWYGHLRFKNAPLFLAIILSWSIAFFEYCIQVPANRIGYRHLTAYQLKIMQECITLLVFFGFAWVVLSERISWRYALSFVLIISAALVAFA